MVKIDPLFNNILLKKEELKEDKTPTGIYIPQEAQGNESPAVGVIEALGKGKVVKKAVDEYGLKTGMKVVYSRYSGTEVKVAGEEYVIISIKDILGVIND